VDYIKLLLLLSLATLSLSATQTTCNNIYFGNDAPDIINTKLTKDTKELCYKEFAVMHSGVSKTPLWSAEHLTRNMLSGKAKRSNEFHVEERLSHDERAELNDYAHSGYDRGHMSPSADFIDAQSNQECFTLANMVPQNHNNNAGLWSHIEGATRYITKKSGEAYIITGPIFQGSNIQRIGGRVLVPTKIFKAIYLPSSNQAAAYITDNAPGDNYSVISIAQLEKLTGINLFPKMSPSVKAQIGSLPPVKGDNQVAFQDNGISQPMQTTSKSNGFFDKLERKIHNFNKGY
jgi:endonuclease G